MKRFIRNLFPFMIAVCITLSLASLASATCQFLGGLNQGVSCYVIDEDDTYCYYRCYCTGTQRQCDEFYTENGLSDV
ncbi:MAG: hypothetical protein ACR2J3_06610 [Aridibacter sp.]